MTTDTPLKPTDAEIADLWHDSRPNRFEVISFARAVLARWGRPAHSGEPVYAFRRKGLDDFCTCTEKRYAELSAKPNLFETRIFYTAPQPVAREPLTGEQIQEVVTKAVRKRKLSWLGFKKDDKGEYTIPVLSPSDYQMARAIERAHGITKGGQHGADT